MHTVNYLVCKKLVHRSKVSLHRLLEKFCFGFVTLSTIIMHSTHLLIAQINLVINLPHSKLAPTAVAIGGLKGAAPLLMSRNVTFAHPGVS